MTGSSAVTSMTSSDPTDPHRKHFARRHGRRYLRDSTLDYPLPCDLAELHRQTLRTMMLCQVFNGPICSPIFNAKPPKRVLEVGCGTAFWSVMCHRHFSNRGCNSISFTGLDVAPLAPDLNADDDMNWRFVQHDMRNIPLPFGDDEFNLIMSKDMSLVTPNSSVLQQAILDEYIRILKPGGVLEIWDSDHSLRMLLPHTPHIVSDVGGDTDDTTQAQINAMGAYLVTPQTPMAVPHNHRLQEYNLWITKVLEARKFSPMPCTLMRPTLLQEFEGLVGTEGRLIAIPLGEVRWEREGIGGASNDVSGHGIKGKVRDTGDRRVLTPGQAALRRTALTTLIQSIESLEPLLREASGKGQDEWDRWMAGLMNDLMKPGGTGWGECLEVAACWAQKRRPEGKSSKDKVDGILGRE